MTWLTASKRRLIALIVISLAFDDGNAQQQQKHVQKAKYHNVDKSVDQARILLKSAGITNTADRLAVMLLFGVDISSTEHGPCFKCAMMAFAKHLSTNTPCDYFVFVKEQNLKQISSLPYISEMKNVFLIALDETDDKIWKMPDWVRSESLGSNLNGWSAGFSIGYRLMGHWRLSFQFPFAKALGYKYLLQTDADTYVESNIEYNLVKFVKEKGLHMTNKDFFFYENGGYYVGLPEMANFWLVTRIPWLATIKRADINIEKIKELGIKGPILKHCTPKDLTGLYTGSGDGKDTERLGWDALCIAGNFNIFDVDWWFGEDVQDFVSMVVRSGAHIEWRWVDVATETMINHLFVPEDKMHVFKDIKIGHGRGDLCTKCGVDWNNTG